MKLLSLADLKSALNLKFRDAPPESGLTIEPSDLKASDVAQLERDLGVKLPSAFSRLILTFDFGELSIGGVDFGSRGKYDSYLKTANSGDMEHSWWGQGERPSSYLLVAGTDGYVILLNTETGGIFAYSRDAHWSSKTRIAVDFEKFVLGCGTLFLEESASADDIAEFVAEAVGAESAAGFWTDRAHGFC